MSVWFDPKEKLPEDGQECLLLPHARGLITQHVYGPIPWHAQSGAWLDIFATPEAGEMVRPDMVALWMDWALIEPWEAPAKEGAEP